MLNIDRCLQNSFQGKGSAYWVRITHDLKSKHIGRHKFNPTGFNEVENAQNRFGLKAIAKVAFVVKWALKAASVEIDSHAIGYKPFRTAMAAGNLDRRKVTSAMRASTGQAWGFMGFMGR